MISTASISSNSSVSNKFDGRAPPRRRAKKDEQDDQPIFLRKAYAMISSCPYEIGGWSEKGDTVIVKDVKAFADKVIPTAYKHNNFSSFVRQLNFYGFRKVKSESLQNPEWWEFKHPNFVRGKPHLISEIKRSMHFESSNVKEISDLKNQVASLTERIHMLNDQVERLTGEVEKIYVTGGTPGKTESSKKRKISSSSMVTPASNLYSGLDQSFELKRMPSLGLDQPIELRRMSSLGSTSMLEDFKASGEQVPEGSDLIDLSWEEDCDQMAADEEESSMFEAFADGFADLPNSPKPPSSQYQASQSSSIEKQVTALPIPPVKSEPRMMENEMKNYSQNVNASESTSDLGGLSGMASMLDNLPADLKARFVDKLAEVVGMQLASAMNTNLPIVKAEPFPENTIQPGQNIHYTGANTFMLPSGTKAPEIALPLASAALGAFVMSSFQNLVNPTNVSASVMKDSVGAK